MMDEAQWAWVWHYRFIHYIDQQDALGNDGRVHESWEIGNVLIQILETDEKLFSILMNARNGEGDYDEPW